jgi:phosphoserine phosphatase
MSIQSSAPPRRLSLFDLDNTLLAGDSDHGWGQFMVRHRLVDPDEYERRNAAFYDDYRAGKLDQMAYLEFSLAPLARYPRDELERWHRRFMAETIEPMMTAKGRALVAERQAAGDLVAIATSTNGFITGPIARAYGVEHLIATDPEIVGGATPGASSEFRHFAKARSRWSMPGSGAWSRARTFRRNMVLQRFDQ